MFGEMRGTPCGNLRRPTLPSDELLHRDLTCCTELYKTTMVALAVFNRTGNVLIISDSQYI